MDLIKQFIDGMCEFNFEKVHIDDSEFIPLLKAGIENIPSSLSSSNEDIQKELFDYALQKYVEQWLKFAQEDEAENNGDELDLAEEKAKARESFLDYYYD